MEVRPPRGAQVAEAPQKQLLAAVTPRAQRFDREMEDVFALQDEITETVVSTLAGRVAHALGYPMSPSGLRREIKSWGTVAYLSNKFPSNPDTTQTQPAHKPG